MSSPLAKILILLLLVCAFTAIDGYAATLTVTKVPDTNDGICDTDCSLREAVSAAAFGDTILFSSLFDSPQTITLTLGHINITKDLTIIGTDSDLITISGNNAGRIFDIFGGATVNLSRMKFRDGNVGPTYEEAYGGAVRVRNSTANLANMELLNNRAFFTNPFTSGGYGSAVYGLNSTLSLTNVNIHHNTGIWGTIWAESGSVLRIIDSSITDNGGGVVSSTLDMLNTLVARNVNGGVGGHHVTVRNSYILNNFGRGIAGGDGASTRTIEDSVISGNTDQGLDNFGFAVIRRSVVSNNRGVEGGGIFNGNVMYIIDSAITGNIATQHGGGIVTDGGQLYITNSTISGNVAGTNLLLGFGGGIYLAVQQSGIIGRITLTNCTIAQNQTSGNGGGFRVDTGGIAVMRNTVIADNTSINAVDKDVSGVINSEGSNLVRNTTGSSGWIAADLLNMNPLLAPLGNNGSGTLTHALLPGSPAINAGNNSLAVDPQTMKTLLHDQRGFDRIGDGKNPQVDIGAYEAYFSVSPVTITGRITTYSGRGIAGSRIKIDDEQGNVFYTQTNPFGYYRLNSLIPGTTYVMTVTHKSYLFTSPQIFTADQNRADLNFIGGL